MSRFVIYGAGAIGGVLGAELFEHGHDVVLIARGAHYEAITGNGLRFVSPDREAAKLSIPVVRHPNEVVFRDDDIVIVAVKSQNTEEVISSLAAYAPTNLPIVCAQNAVINEDIALRRFANVYATCAMIPASHLRPGEVISNASPVSGMLRIGRYPSGLDATARTVAAAIDSTRMVSVLHEEIRPFKYAKLIGSLGSAAFALIAGENVAMIAREAEIEGEETLRRAAIPFVSQEELRTNYEIVQHRQVNGWEPGKNSSWQSLNRGQGSIESDYLNGEIVWLGRLFGIATPINATLQRLGNEAARSRQPPRSISESKFMEFVETGRS